MIRPEDITIIIPHLGATREQVYALGACLESLQWTAPRIKKILVVNGPAAGSEDTDLQMSELLGPIDNLSLMLVEEQGQCRAVNAAVATTNTPYLFITNDDMVYPAGWFKRFTEHEVLPACMSPMLVEPRPGAPTFRTQFFGGAGGDFDAEGWEKFAADWTTPEDYRNGFNLPLLIDRRLWQTVGGYDINYDPWGSNSDSDLEYKIKLAGVQPIQNTNCIVYHFSQTSGTFEPKNDAARHKNYAYFKEKWGFDRTDDGIWEATFAIPGKDGGRIYWPEWEGKYGK